MLCNLCKGVAGLEHMHVFFEILVVMGVKQYPSLIPFVEVFFTSILTIIDE